MLHTNDNKSLQSRARLQVLQHSLEVIRSGPYHQYHQSYCGDEASLASMILSCVAGAAIAGGTHYVATAKRLVEEGVDPTQRVKAMPVAVGPGLLWCQANSLSLGSQLASAIPAASRTWGKHSDMHSCWSSCILCFPAKRHQCKASS